MVPLQPNERRVAASWFAYVFSWRVEGVEMSQSRRGTQECCTTIRSRPRRAQSGDGVLTMVAITLLAGSSWTR